MLTKYQFLDCTKQICSELGVNPLRLISSGSMVIAIENGEELVVELAKNGINATVIGKFTNEGLYIVNKGEKQVLEEPDVDELYKYNSLGYLFGSLVRTFCFAKCGL